MFRPTSLKEVKSGLPMLDYVNSLSNNKEVLDYTLIAKKKRLKYLVLRHPELAGMIWDIAEDIVGKYDFVPVAGKRGNGRNRILNVKKWSRNSNLRDSLLSAIFDALACGEGYIFLGAKSARIREEIDKIASATVSDALIDESMFNPMFRPISSVLMTNKHNEYNLTGYTQLVNGSEISYSIKEIIHLFFKRQAGMVDGFTLVSTLPLQLELLWLLWTNQYDLQAKGNMPDMFVIAKEIRDNTPALRELESKLRKYNMPGNSKHGATVLYGSDYTIEKMERDTSLQFEDVGKAITSVIAGLFRYPKHRLGIKTKESASEKDSQGNGDRDYWDMISKYQDKISDIFDSQLFEPFFGVQIVFDKSYKHDSIVENTAMRSRIDNINLVNTMLRNEKERIPKDDVLRFIQGKNIDFQTEQIPEEELMEIQLANEQPMQGTPAKQKDEALSREKRRTEANVSKNTGKPGGV